MKTCPSCGESFGEELNFCDVDGAALARDPESAVEERNKLWSILGVGLLLGALVISALSIVFLPTGRGSAPPVVSSATETKPAADHGGPAPTETASVAAPSVSSEPEAAPPTDTLPLELKKKAPLSPTDPNIGKSAKAAALAAEGIEKPASQPEPAGEPPAAIKPETAAIKPTSDNNEPDAASASASSADPKAANSKKQDKDSDSKKKGDDKEKKKGGFFKVFKKIFGKD